VGEIDCRNCSQSSFFNSVACQEVRSMEVGAAEGGSQYVVQGSDSYKADEYFQLAVLADRWRSAAFQQKECTNNRHKFAQFCGGYATRDGDAWMRHALSTQVVRLANVPFGALADYTLVWEGLCRPCESCVVGYHNAQCVRGVKGACAACRALVSCLAAPAHYLHHPHPLECEQEHALEDYECRRCLVWARVGPDHMLVVGCGRQELVRWTPTAEFVDGRLAVVTCALNSDAPADLASPQ